MTIHSLKAELDTATPAQAIELLSRFIDTHPDCEEAYTLRGMRFWAQGKRSLAINDYLAALRINPDSPARTALEAANGIMNYYNKDLYNP